MLDPHSREVLQQVVRRESRSLLQYVSEAFPWTRPEDEQTVQRLRQFAREQSEAVAHLTRYLQRQHATMTYLGAFPASFTSLNFVTLDYLQPLLAQHADREIALLEKDLKEVTDSEARTLLSELMALKMRQRSELSSNNVLPPATHVTHVATVTH